MRSRRLIIVLLLALASGLAAGWLALNYLRQPNSPISTSAPDAVEVVVASRDLPVGHVLEVADIKVAQWPGDAVPEGYSSSVDEVLGRGLIQRVAMNEPLMPAKIALKEAGGGLPIVIPEGMRAVSIRVDEVIQVAGFVGPGTRVDVLVTLEGENQPDPITKIVLQNMLVLTSGQIVERSPNGEPVLATVVTFLSSPEDAEKLVMSASARPAQHSGPRFAVDRGRSAGISDSGPEACLGTEARRSYATATSCIAGQDDRSVPWS